MGHAAVPHPSLLHCRRCRRHVTWVRPRCAHSQLARDLEPTCLVCGGALTAYHTVLHCVRERTAHRVLLWTTPGLLVHPAGRRVSTPALGTARYSTYEMTEESVAVTCDSDL